MAGAIEEQAQADARPRGFGVMSTAMYVASIMVLLMIAAALRYRGKE